MLHFASLALVFAVMLNVAASANYLTLFISRDSRLLLIVTL